MIPLLKRETSWHSGVAALCASLIVVPFLLCGKSKAETFELNSIGSIDLTDRKRDPDDIMKSYDLKPVDRLPNQCGTYRDYSFNCVVVVPAHGENEGGKSAYDIVTAPAGATQAFGQAPFPAPLPVMAMGLDGITTENLDSYPEKRFQVSRREPLGPATYEFVQALDVIEGFPTIADWDELARDEIIFGCEGVKCLRVVFAHTKHPVFGEIRGLASCMVLTSKGKVGPPVTCQFIVVHFDQVTYMLAATQFEKPPMTASKGREDFRISVEGYFDNPMELSFKNPESLEIYQRNIHKTQSEGKLKQAIINSLRLSPLRLDIEEATRFNTISLLPETSEIIGINDYFYLEEVKKWTRQTVRVNMRGFTSKGPLLSIATTLYVSPQNSPERRDWQMPSEVEEENYVGLLLAGFKRHLPEVCRGSDYKWMNDGTKHTLICEAN